MIQTGGEDDTSEDGKYIAATPADRRHIYIYVHGVGPIYLAERGALLSFLAVENISYTLPKQPSFRAVPGLGCSVRQH